MNRNIKDYLQKAGDDYESHAWDQWSFEQSAMEVARDAARRGEISRSNVSFLAHRIIAANEAASRAAEASRKAQAAVALAALESSPLWEAWTPAQRTEAARRIGNGWPLANIQAGIDAWTAEQARQAEQAVRDSRTAEAEPMLKAVFEAEGKEHTETWEGSWVSHEDSFGGLSGGDYEGGGSGPTQEFLKELEAVLTAQDFTMAMDGLRARLELAYRSEDRKLMAGGGWTNPLHVARMKSKWAQALIPNRQARAERERLRRDKFTREERERIAAAGEAAQEEENRIRDIRTIRAQWRTIGTHSWRARSARRGGRCGYHPEAIALYERIKAAQARATELRQAREAREREEDMERRTRSERAAEEARKQEKASWLSAGAWSGLDKMSV